MATKITPKSTVKETPKDKTKEAEQAAREQMMEKSVVKLMKPIEAYQAAEAEVQSAEYDIIDALKVEVEKNEFTQKEASQVIKKALYDAKGLDIAKDKNPSINSKVSRYVNLLGLFDKEVNGKTVKAETLAARIEEAKEKDVPIAVLHQIASGNLLPKDALKKKPKGNQHTNPKDETLVNGKKPYTDATAFGNDLGAMLSRASKGKVDDSDVLATMLEQYFFSRKTLDEGVEDDTLQTEVIDASEVALASANAAYEKQAK